MEELYQLSIALATLLQEAYPRLLGLMTIVSALGSEEFFLVFLPAVYWSIDKRLGRQLGYIFLLSALINNMLKNMIRQPRPFWLEPDIKQGDADGYGIPSGHVQNVTAVFLLLAASVRRNWAWLLALLYILLMALSRLYLGVHFCRISPSVSRSGCWSSGRFSCGSKLSSIVTANRSSAAACC